MLTRVLFAERPPGYDRVRNAEIGNKDFELDVLEEAYTNKHLPLSPHRLKTLITEAFHEHKSQDARIPSDQTDSTESLPL